MRAAYILKVKPGKEEAYRDAHKMVWPELIAEASKAGIRNHSCFMHGRKVVVYLEADDIEASTQELMHKDVKRRWNKFMEEFLEDETVPLEEVFYME